MTELDYHRDADGVMILDSNGDPIPAHICICHAYDEYECACGAWDIPVPDDAQEIGALRAKIEELEK